jgi:endo-1,4-beta-xylanase
MIKKYFIISGVVILCFTPVFLYAQNEHKEKVCLKTLAEARGRFIGTAVDNRALAKDKKYAQVLAEEFNVVTPENALKFDAIEPKKGKFDFRYGDAIVNFALAHHMKIRGHTLVWHEQLPSWLTERKYTKGELEEILHDHIKAEVGHYKGKVYCWDVVNEAFNADGSFRHSIWYDTIGPEYIEKSFRWAHETDPDALLFYNDFGAEISNTKSDRIYLFLRELINKKVPIDGIGLQAHLDIDFDNIKSTDSNIKRFADLGLQTNFTELDVSTINDKNISREQRFAKQADVYGTIVTICLDNPSCKMVVMWGFTDAHSWKKRMNKDDAPAIFDEQYNPKPAYDEIIKLFAAAKSIQHI